ncbi:MAG: hypothetical protein Tsb0020_24290 [Haliangiales bacterium]
MSVWSDQPSADELLDQRLRSGWQPTPTGTVDGDVIMGHAACRVELAGARDRGA